MDLDMKALAGQLQAPVRVGFAQTDDDGPITNPFRERALLPPGWTAYEQKVPAPAPLKFRTLSGVVDYLSSIGAPSVIGALKPSGEPDVFVTVVDYDQVEVRGAVEGHETDFRRVSLVVASPHLPVVPLGSWMTLEDALTQLCTVFQKTTERDELVKLFASVEENDVRTSTDNGVAQTVAVKTGVKLAMEQVPNPVLLRPFRTFHEVEQPASLFYLRMRKGANSPEVCLNEADGGAWKRAAVVAVGDWLRGKLEGKGVLVLA